MAKARTKAGNRARKNQIPLPALVLGFAGLIPFFASALASVFLDAELQTKASFALAAYGAVILSFLGGVKWGAVLHDKTALNRWGPLILSVLPSIVAWLALLMPPLYLLSTLAAAFVAQYYLDSKSVQQKALPDWYGRLRMLLSAGAVLSLLLGLIAQVM